MLALKLARSRIVSDRQKHQAIKYFEPRLTFDKHKHKTWINVNILSLKPCSSQMVAVTCFLNRIYYCSPSLCLEERANRVSYFSWLLVKWVWPELILEFVDKPLILLNNVSLLFNFPNQRWGTSCSVLTYVCTFYYLLMLYLTW